MKTKFKIPKGQIESLEALEQEVENLQSSKEPRFAILKQEYEDIQVDTQVDFSSEYRFLEFTNSLGLINLTNEGYYRVDVSLVSSEGGAGINSIRIMTDTGDFFNSSSGTNNGVTASTGIIKVPEEGSVRVFIDTANEISVVRMSIEQIKIT